MLCIENPRFATFQELLMTFSEMLMNVMFDVCMLYIAMFFMSIRHVINFITSCNIRIGHVSHVKVISDLPCTCVVHVQHHACRRLENVNNELLSRVGIHTTNCMQ